MDREQIDWMLTVKAVKITEENIQKYLGHCDADKYRKTPGKNSYEKGTFIFNFQNEPEKPKEKIKINLLVADDRNYQSEVEYLSEDYDITVISHADRENHKIDLVLFTGGEDVNPELYGEKTGRFTGVNKKRDILEQSIFNEYYHTPKLGICRGNQLLTVLSGGKLIQHVEGHGGSHTIIVEGKGRYNMTSTHHQMVYPYDMNKNSYELIAYSEYFKSNTYLNGNNEEIVKPKEFLEPEIVFYNGTKSLCIQGHPEYSGCEQKTKRMCLNLISEYLLNTKSELKPKNTFQIPSWMNSDEEEDLEFESELSKPDYYGKIKENSFAYLNANTHQKMELESTEIKNIEKELKF